MNKETSVFKTILLFIVLIPIYTAISALFMYLFLQLFNFLSSIAFIERIFNFFIIGILVWLSFNFTAARYASKIIIFLGFKLTKQSVNFDKACFGFGIYLAIIFFISLFVSIRNNSWLSTNFYLLPSAYYFILVMVASKATALDRKIFEQ